MRTSQLTNVAEVRAAAYRSLPRALFDYVDGGADDEITMRANEAAFASIGFVPRMAEPIERVNLRTEVFGTTVSMPVLVAPCGLQQALAPGGPLAVAAAAERRGTISVLSTVAGATPEEVASVPGPKWFQLYSPGGEAEWGPILERVDGLGYEALVVTVDTPALGNRERDHRNGVAGLMLRDPRSLARLASQVAVRPGWAWRMGAGQVRRRRAAPAQGGPEVPTVDLVAAGGSPFTWEDIATMRGRWTKPLLVKGVLSAEDAVRARDAGCDGVIVSNHGGRQLDGAPATVSVLPGIVDAVGSSTTVLVDGGVRRGSDVMKALAIGARAVLIGRPYLYGLAAGGQEGVERVLDIFRSDLKRTMKLLGCGDVGRLDRTWITLPEG